MSQTKTARLNALYERLKSANGISIKDLAAEFEVSAKTIQRYFKALQSKFVLDESIEKRLKNAHSVWFNLDEPFLVRLFIDKKVAKYFKRKAYAGATIYEQADESIVLELEISHIMQIKPLIYEYIPHIRVIEPAWLNEALKKELSNFAKSL